MILSLSIAGFLAAGLFGLAGAAALFRPAAALRAAEAFPRHAGAGRLLCAAALLVVTVSVGRADLGRFNGFKPALVLLGPAAFVLVSWLLSELLAARALGGLLLLGAHPVLAAVRVETTPWRIALSLAAYAAVVAGMVLVVGPHWFRRAARPALGTRGRAALAGSIGLALGLGFLLLAAGPYRAGG